MTLVIAIASDTGVVMAADSQATAGSSKGGRATKITPIKFANGCALIGEAGSAVLSRRALKEIELVAPKMTIEDERTIPRVAQNAIRTARLELRRQNFGCGAEELQRIIQAAGGLRWLVASFFNAKPAIFEIGMTLGLDYEVREQCAAIGSGSLLAKYLLDRVVWPGMGIAEAEMAAVYVVEEVKKQDLYCGGATHTAFVNMEMAVFDSPARLRYLAEFAERADAILKKASLKIIQREFRDSFTDFCDAMKEIEHYVTKHPGLEKKTIGQIVRRMEADRKREGAETVSSKAGLLNTVPPYITRLLARKKD